VKTGTLFVCVLALVNGLPALPRLPVLKPFKSVFPWKSNPNPSTADRRLYDSSWVTGSCDEGTVALILLACSFRLALGDVVPQQSHAFGPETFCVPLNRFYPANMKMAVVVSKSAMSK
jgi:hypothetical protein